MPRKLFCEISPLTYKISIKKELKELIPLYMIPKSFIFLKSFPVNKNGKIDRKALSNYD